MSQARKTTMWIFLGDTHDTSLKQWLSNCNYLGRLIKIAKAHDGGIVAVAVDPAHNTLVIAEEKDGETGHGVDEDEESAGLILAGYIVAGDVVHDCFLFGPLGEGMLGLCVITKWGEWGAIGGPS